VLWDPWTGRETLRIKRRVGTFRFDLAFSPDGSRLYTTAAVTGVDVWDLASGEEVATLWGERPPLQDGAIGEGLRAERIAAGPDGLWLAAAIYGDPLQIIDTRSGQLIRRLTGLDHPATCVTVSNDRLLAISEGALHVWNTGTWEEVTSIKGPSGQVAATEDGAAAIYTIPEERTLTIWNLDSGTAIDQVDVASKPTALAVRGRAIWVGCEDGTVRRYQHRP
jgi:WD40 repeat protein